METGVVVNVLNTLAKDCNDYAVSQGFWEDEDTLLKYIDNKFLGKEITPSGLQFLKNRIILLFNSEKIALEMSELGERLETLRQNPTAMDEHCPEFLSVEVECADLIIRCLDFCGRRKLRIGEALVAKMEYNTTREYKHGKKF